eukprot:122372-Amorphochlora_amoeboformis.AAC.2
MGGLVLPLRQRLTKLKYCHLRRAHGRSVTLLGFLGYVKPNSSVMATGLRSQVKIGSCLRKVFRVANSSRSVGVVWVLDEMGAGHCWGFM